MRQIKNLTKPMGSPETSASAPSVVITAAYGDATKDDFLAKLLSELPRWLKVVFWALMVAMIAAHAAVQMNTQTSTDYSQAACLHALTDKQYRK